MALQKRPLDFFFQSHSSSFSSAMDSLFLPPRSLLMASSIANFSQSYSVSETCSRQFKCAFMNFAARTGSRTRTWAVVREKGESVEDHPVVGGNLSSTPDSSSNSIDETLVTALYIFSIFL